MIRVALADRHRLLLDGLEHLLASEPDIQVIASCTSATAALRAVAEHAPDVLVLDVQWPDHDGVSVLRDLERMKAAARVVVIAAELAEEDVLAVVQLGARGLILKDMPAQLLVDCIRQVHAGALWLERQATARALERLVRPRSTESGRGQILTSREIEIVRLATRGLRNKEIGGTLHISEGTVKNHLHNIYEKLGVRDRLQLSLYAQHRDSLQVQTPSPRPADLHRPVLAAGARP